MYPIELYFQNNDCPKWQVVFTDNGSKDLKLKKEILQLKADKSLEIFIVLTPEYEGRPEDESLKVYFTNQVYLKARPF